MSNVSGSIALDISLQKYQALLKENILLTTRVLELEKELKKVEQKTNE